MNDFPPKGIMIPDLNLVGKTGEHTKGILTAMGGNEDEKSRVDKIVKEAMNGTRTDLVRAILDIESIPEGKHGDGGHGLQG